MQNKIINIQPVALTTTLTTNILNCGITSLTGPIGFTATQPYLLIKHVRVTNKTASPANVSLWKGATGANAAGTEWNWSAVPVPANSWIESFQQSRLDSPDFIVGGSSAPTALTIVFEGEIGFA